MKPLPYKTIIIVLVAIVAVVLILKSYFAAETFEYAGTLETTNVDISSQLPSLITYVNVWEGDCVYENQNLIVLDCSDVKLIDDLANINFARNSTLFKSGTVSQDTLDQVKNVKDIANVRKSWCEIFSALLMELF